MQGPTGLIPGVGQHLPGFRLGYQEGTLFPDVPAIRFEQRVFPAVPCFQFAAGYLFEPAFRAMCPLPV